MKIESLRVAKAKLSEIINELPSSRSVVITKNGRPCAVLLQVTEETDLESLLLSQRPDFLSLLDRAHEEGETKGFTRLADLEAGTPRPGRQRHESAGGARRRRSSV